MNLWWLDTNPAALWSPEERRARMAIYGLAIPIFLAIFGVEILAFNPYLDNHIVAMMGALSAVPSVFASRGVCVKTWPELMKRADENAARRLAN